jgi:DNA invertase Pin-like site-specific DNA recombinase
MHPVFQERISIKMFDETKRAAIYARTATVKAQHETNSSTGQVAGCTEYIMKQGYLLNQDHIYIDGSTATKGDERSAFSSLRQAIARQEIDVVVVYSLDRIAGNLAQIEAFVVEAESRGVAIEAALEPHLDGISVTKFIQSRRNARKRTLP